MMNVMDMLNENIGDYKVQNQWSEAVKTWKRIYSENLLSLTVM